MTRPECETCIFFSVLPTSPNYEGPDPLIRGQCRRRAPMLDHREDKPRTIWPMVLASHFCGEHGVAAA